MLVKPSHYSPAQIIFCSFFLTIILGALLLALPISRTIEIPFIDLLFTATSATCVTGLFTVSLFYGFTFFGKCVILALVQIGGLGLITMTLFIASLFVDFGLGTQLIAGQILELETWKKIKNTLVFIIVFTLYMELLGAFLTFLVIQGTVPTHEAWLIALFHGVASFCNAGFSLITDQPEVIGTNNLILLTTSLLMFVGGLGFITWHELATRACAAWNKTRYRLSLHSKIILYGSTTALIGSAILFWILERNNTLAHLGVVDTFINTLFHAISFKSAGFTATHVSSFLLPTLFLIMIISFVGSSPGSTGSGVKITTMAIFIAAVKSAISGRTSVEIRGRMIPIDQVYRSVAIIALSIGWILLNTFCLLITEKEWSFLDTLFESLTAFTSVGLSTGGTATLSFAGKILIMMSMFIGRIGSFTLILALRLNRKKETREFTYPEERVMLG